jgi:tetraacyldisaccharide 4'-kinase
MIRTAPLFWGGKPGLTADLLSPLGVAWDGAGRLRRALARPYRPPVPVFCVGNLVAGGAGKTPVTMALAEWLRARGIAAHVVTRGYRGRLAGPIRVDAARHDAGEVGDEALLLAVRTPVWVARDRAAGAAAAVVAGAELLLLDDGFQNPAVEKTLSLIVVDTGYGFGNGRVMPAGPLRENLRRGLARADAMVWLAVPGAEGSVVPQLFDRRLCIIPAVLTAIDGERFAGDRVYAFAGIGRPVRFFATLRALGANVVAERSFPDHHAFCERDLDAVSAAARRLGARLVTTAKDFVRLPAAARDEIAVLEVEVRWPDPGALAGLLAPALGSVGMNAHPLQPPR